jgi:predicted transposase/invertase (TIGR01784 family)
MRRGDGWEKLDPVVCIVFLDDAQPSGRFHARYEVREVHDHTPLTDALQIHLVELPRLGQAAAEGEQEDLQRWARFLRAESEPELESLASEVPIMAAAKEALEVLSREPSAQRMAQYREDAAIERRLDRADALAEGREEGRVEGLVALRGTVLNLCAAFAIPLDDARRAVTEGADLARLKALSDHVLAHRAWPT